MGHQKCHIPDLETLRKQYDTLGIDKFVSRYKKCECLIGDSEAIRYIEHVFELVKEINSK